MKVKLLSFVRLFAAPWTVAYQASPSMGFSRQEYWSGLPFPSPGDLPDPGIELGSLAFQVIIIFITSTIVGLQVQQQGGNTALPSTENWIKDLLNTAPPIRTRPSFPLSQSLPAGTFHKPLIPIHQRVDRMKTTVTEN